MSDYPPELTGTEQEDLMLEQIASSLSLESVTDIHSELLEDNTVSLVVYFELGTSRNPVFSPEHPKSWDSLRALGFPDIYVSSFPGNLVIRYSEEKNGYYAILKGEIDHER